MRYRYTATKFKNGKLYKSGSHHSADIEHVRDLYKKFTKMSVEDFRENLNIESFRIDLQHFMAFVAWLKVIKHKDLIFLLSDYGAMHLLIHFNYLDNQRDQFAKNVQDQIKHYFKVPVNYSPNKLIELGYEIERKEFLIKVIENALESKTVSNVKILLKDLKKIGRFILKCIFVR